MKLTSCLSCGAVLNYSPRGSFHCHECYEIMRVENAELRLVLEMVEWVLEDEALSDYTQDGVISYFCPWCGGYKPKHKPSCDRQKKLGLVDIQIMQE